MQKNWFLVRDFLSVKLIKHISGCVSLAIFSLSVMSFTNGSLSKKGKKTSKDSLNTRGFKNLLLTDDNPPPVRVSVPLNQKIISFVSDYIREQQDAYSNMREWGQGYFDLFDKVLSDNGLPVGLKYLSVIESDLRGNLSSCAGALGPWQLMPDEAKRFHLKTGKGHDDRTSFLKSTQVAAKLLKELHNQFGDWLLVIAAYNCGTGRLKQAIRKAGTSDFWALENYLPQETRYHVKKYIATYYFFEGSGGITTMTANETASYNDALMLQNAPLNVAGGTSDSTTTVDVNGKYNSSVISRMLSLDTLAFNRLNPFFNNIVSAGKTYHLRIPANKLALFLNSKQQILQQSVQELFSQTAFVSAH